MANGDILDALEAKIANGLKNKRLTDKERTQLEIQQLLVIFLKEDHATLKEMRPQVDQMWKSHQQEDTDRREYRKMWVTPLVGTVVTTGISLLFTGLMFYLWIFPQIKVLSLMK